MGFVGSPRDFFGLKLLPPFDDPCHLKSGVPPWGYNYMFCVYLQVQTGFGRLGSHYWGFETQDVIPDIGMSEKKFNFILLPISPKLQFQLIYHRFF